MNTIQSFEDPGAVSTEAPPVSLGLPVFNGENYIAETLESILSQSFHDFELIISDNASTDDTEQICRRFADRDARIRYIRQPENMGAAANYDFVFHQSRGTYFKWCAHDDVLGERFIEACVTHLDEHASSVGALPRDIRVIDGNGALLSRVDIDLDPSTLSPARRFAHYLRQDPPTHCSPFFALYRRAALAKTNLHGDYVSSDRVLIGEMLLHGRLALVDGAASFSFRQHDQQYSARMLQGQEFSIAWIDPQKSRSWTFRDFRYVYEYTRSVARARLPLRERLFVYGSIAGFAWSRRARLAKEMMFPVYRNGRLTAFGQRVRTALMAGGGGNGPGR